MKWFGWIFLQIVLIIGLMGGAQAVPCSTTPTVGSLCTFKGYDFTFSVPAVVDVHTTCQLAESLGNSRNLYIYVADNIWMNSINLLKIEKVAEALTTTTEAFPDSGIIDTLQTVIGSIQLYPSGNNKNLYLVIHNITTSDFHNARSYIRDIDYEFDSFNRPVDGSNGLPVFFLDDSDLTGTSGQTELVRVYADRVVHSYDQNEVLWVRDAISRAMTFYLGYTGYQATLNRYAENPNVPLIATEATALNHGATTLFGLFVLGTYGPGFMLDWSRSTDTGMAGFERALEWVTGVSSFCESFHLWAIQNKVNSGALSYSVGGATLPHVLTYSIIQNPETEGRADPSLSAFAASNIEINVGAVSLEETEIFEAEYAISNTDGLRASAVLFNAENPAQFTLKDLTVFAGQPSMFLFDKAGEAYNRIALISSRCIAADNPLPYTVTTRIKAPPIPDGDADDEPDIASESDENGDADLPESDDTDTESDKPDAPTIVGTNDCHELNACILDNPGASGAESCMAEAAPDAQTEWAAYQVCIKGQNPDEVNCLDLSDSDQQTECVMRYCSAEYEVCKLIENIAPDRKDLGSSSCRQGTETPASVLGLLLCLLALSWGRRRTRRES